MKLKLKYKDTFQTKNLTQGSLVYIGLYTTQACNLKCKYCFEDAGIKAANELSLDTRLSLLDQAKKLGAKVLWIAGAGEPLIDDALFPMIEYAHKLGMGIIIYTNGLQNDSSMKIRTLDQDKADFLFSHDVTLIVKLESLNEKTHDFLTGVPGSYVAAQKTIDTLITAGYGLANKDNIVRLAIAAIYTKQNINELPALKKWCDEKNILLLVDILGVHGRAKQYPDILPTKEDILRVRSLLGGESSMVENNECLIWKYGLIIDHQGNTRFCTEIKTNNIGNINDYSLEKLLDIKNKKYPIRQGKFTCPLKVAPYLSCNGCQQHNTEITINE